jgi:hypothetical protein
VYGVSDVRQLKIHTAALAPFFSSDFALEYAIKKFQENQVGLK